MAIVATTKTVTSAGTAEALTSSSVLASSVIIRAMEDNTGYVYVGDSTVSSSTGALEQRTTIAFGGDNNVGTIDLADVYVDADTNGDGVDIWYVVPGVYS